jgi:hypothetical protein
MMGFLNPALLFLGLAVAVPLVLHLFQRQQGPRLLFPALRYLRRAEKESARRIRLRQLLLLALRMGVLVLLALAAARPFLKSGAARHEPTAVAIVLDNSLSSGQIVGDRRVLDVLKERAMETLAHAGPDDRFWLIRVGEPWEPAVPGDAESTARRVQEVEVAATAGDLTAAVARARALLAAGAEGRRTEIHVLSDLQATGLGDALPAGKDAPPVLLWDIGREAPANAGVAAVEVGGGLAPRAGDRSTVAVTVAGFRRSDSVTVRLALDGRIGAAAIAPVGAATVLSLPARPVGLVSGWVEIDPDALRGDDRRYFVVRVEPSPAVALTRPLPFVDEALDVLAGAGRIRRVSPGEADVLVAPSGLGADALRSRRSVVILPPHSPLELPALNRRLQDAGVPWRFTLPKGDGEARFAAGSAEDDLTLALERVRVGQAYGLERLGGGTGSASQAGASDSVLLRLRDGAPWVVRGETPDGGRYLLVASPLSTEATSLPTSSAMIPLLDRLVGPWAAAAPPRLEATPGEVVALPPEADRIERPDGQRDERTQGGEYRVPALPGIYRVYAGERLVSAFAVNPPASESALERADRSRLRAALPGWQLDLADAPGEWARKIFRHRVGREVWRPLVLLTLALLLLEGLIAAAGRARPGAGTPHPDGDTDRQGGTQSRWAWRRLVPAGRAGK